MLVVELANSRVALAATHHTKEYIARIERDRVEYGLLHPQTAANLLRVAQ
jgi:hypothetical protein